MHVLDEVTREGLKELFVYLCGLYMLYMHKLLIKR